MGAVLGDPVMGPGLSQTAGGPHWHVVLAVASLRANYFFVTLPFGGDARKRCCCVPDRSRGTRAEHRGGGSSPLGGGRLWAALPGSVHARGAANAGTAARAG